MDANAYASHKKDCKLCNRKGLLILPTRYAIAPKASKAPILDDDTFKATPNGFSYISLDPDTHYTQRLMRAGYLYVYDETKKGFKKNKETGTFEQVPDPWQSYVINDKGFLMPYSPWAESPLSTEDNVPCDPWENEMLARCITIEKPNEPRPIWIGFSDTIWTQNVFEKNERAIRDKGKSEHMRKLDIAALWGGGAHPHACSIEQCDKHVAEMSFSSSLDPSEVVKGQKITDLFDFSPSPLAVPTTACNLEAMAKACGMKNLNYPLDKNMKDEIIKNYSLFVKNGEHTEMPHLEIPAEFQSGGKDSLIRAAKRLLKDDWKKAAIVALDDPVGIVKDLAIYINSSRIKHYAKVITKERERKIAIAGVLECLRDGIKRQARDKLEHDSELYIYQDANRMRATMGQGGGSSNYPEIRKVGQHTPPAFPYEDINSHHRAIAQGIRKNPDKVKEYLDDAWSKYEDKLIEKGAIEKTKENHKADIEQFDQGYTIPLCKAFVAWLNSPIFISTMDNNHDTSDMCNGVCYANIVSLCMATTQEFAPILAEIERQLSADALDKTNVLSRALVYNQDMLAEEVRIAISESKSITVQSAIAEGTEEGEIISQWKFWSKVLGRVEKAVKETLKGSPADLAEIREAGATKGVWDAAKKISAKLTAQFSAAVVSLSQETVTSVLVPTWAVKFGCTGHIPVIRLELVDNIQGGANYLADHYIHAVPKNLKMNKREIYKFFQKKLEEARAVALKDRTSMVVYVIPNEPVIRQRMERAAASGSGGVGSGAVTENTRVVPEDKLKNKLTYEKLKRVSYKNGEVLGAEFYDANNPARTEAQLARSKARISNAVESKVSPTAGILTGILQLGLIAATVSKTTAAIKSGDLDKVVEAKAVLIATLLSSVENFGKAMEGAAAYYPSLAEKRFLGVYWFDKSKPFLKYWAKVFGIAGGAIMGVVDIYDVADSAQKGQIGMAGLYIASTIANIGGAIVLTYITFGNPGLVAMLAAVGLGIGLVVLGIAAAIAIAIWKDNDLQDWIGRCILGNYTGKKFESLPEELLALERLQAA